MQLDSTTKSKHVLITTGGGPSLGERGVGYVKSNAIAAREFASWAMFEAHLERRTREVA